MQRLLITFFYNPSRMKIKDILNCIERKAPLSLQESYDNAGLQVGDAEREVTGVLLCLDATPAVLQEAIDLGVNLIISHHPLIFKEIKSICKGNVLGDMLFTAIEKGICIYSAHTNLDSMLGGVSYALAKQLGLKNLTPMDVSNGKLYKLVVFVPQTHKDAVCDALFAAGAGMLGNYTHCSFSADGVGTFLPQDGANPFIGSVASQTSVAESRVEVLVKESDLSQVTKALRASHPYEEPAYDVIAIENQYVKSALGVVGELEEPLDVAAFLQHVKQVTGASVRYTETNRTTIQRIALCGGSGSFLIPKALSLGVDAYLTGDIKYHDFFLASSSLLLADIGHYESEKFALSLLGELIEADYAGQLQILETQVKTNPINYI